MTSRFPTVDGLPEDNDDTGAAEVTLDDIRRNWGVALALLLGFSVFAVGLFWVDYCLKKDTKKRCMSRIPVVVHGSGSGDPECSICLGEVLDGERVRVMPKCNHEFHVSCIDKWLAAHSSCPNCRHSIAGGGGNGGGV
ncbi:RING-H2 finger protein ATL74 [Linum perenne]